MLRSRGGRTRHGGQEKTKRKNKIEHLCSRIMFCLLCFSSKEYKCLAQKSILLFLINLQKQSL